MIPGLGASTCCRHGQNNNNNTDYSSVEIKVNEIKRVYLKYRALFRNVVNVVQGDMQIDPLG